MNTLGFTQKIQELIPSNISPEELGRITAEHKERYVMQSAEGTFHAEITGNLRFSAQSKADFPAVGDWVRYTKMDEQNAIILEVFSRYSTLERQAVGKNTDVQIIAANIDYAFIVQAVGHDFNLNRLERYLSICYAAKIEPLIILTKTDLVSEEETTRLVDEISKRVKKVPVIALSNITQKGLGELFQLMKPYNTYCFIGSSGVGKSTIINHLKNEEVLKTNSISESTNKGKHTTSHRELFLLNNNSIVIDTPGMRELGLTDVSGGIELTFDEIVELAKECRFKDCTHTSETGCAVLEALENEELPYDVYNNYQKLMREQEHFTSSVHEKRQRDKDFGKMIKVYKNQKKQNKL